MRKVLDILFSFKITLVLLAILAVGAGVATFIENDFGTSSARVLVYNNIWYETILVLTTVNLIGIILKFKMWKHPPRFIFHLSFVIILIGAGVTRYMGYEGIIHIREGATENRMISLEPYLQINIKQEDGSYYKEYPLELTALGSNNFSHTIKFNNKELVVKYKDFMYAKKGRDDMSILTVDVVLNGQTKAVKLPGKRGMEGFPKVEDFGDTVVTLEYGSKVLELPFSIKLRDFQLDRYPGSMAPSSYASEVTVMKDNKEYDYRIFMNRTLHEGNFLFFQSSYDQDEQGTVLSVNNDPGKWPTYLGYFLLTLGLILNLFDKKSRFWKLTKYVSSKNVAAAFLAACFIFAGSPQGLQAQEQTTNTTTNTHGLDFEKTKNDMLAYLENYQSTSKATAEKFSKIVVQSNGGRMKPLNTLDYEIVNKLTGKSSMFGMNADQIVLGMLTRPEIWRNVKMIKIKTPKLKKVLGIEESRNYIAFSEVFDKEGRYILAQEAQNASMAKPNERGTFEREIIKLDEKLNISYLVYNGNLFNMFPSQNLDDNNRWYNPLEAINTFKGDNQVAIESLIRGFISSTVNENWDLSNSFIDMIIQYQEKVGSEVIPPKSQIENEILFNKLGIFPKLTIAYMILGLIILIVAFIVVFNPKIKPKKTTFVFFIILAILFALHTFGMGFRWIISGHAPWSDTYESLLYISWSAVFAAVIFFRKSLLALSAGVIVAGIFMFTAHLTSIDPQITNLVPVLKSYWLTIHVSVLTASYGFFGLSAILGFMSLIMFIFRKNRPHLNETIKHITAINEISLIIGLSAITIGNFLGGVWANESWGRYWGWDPKETWAYVSIVIYALVVHLRFIKSLNTPFTLSVASLLAFSTILMTYFGVNFYLSGMHSYATGDPVPIPMWVYYVTATVFVTIALAYKNRDIKDTISDT
ncbi:cytochrome c biogenesis protein CcsA [Halarcobacter ebronensis]|uniref:Cytochrome C biogenesis protein n=1 Tax=Halarcobacter ebronensis TaxID=1462615 RepID=A0A4Q1ALU9_9BACT|nr:cytochrome c biogenesis protein CcsA [Halarcobacter ebronensis]QKF81927.1 cytochrome c biogenesis protein [Halarcobacter ebronensis]RXK04354.1 cytochrome C biogenesis protein [Halarcobacter ebronensis]